MIGDTLTTENLLAIFEAMSKIKPIDRSQCFDNYYDEIIERLVWKELDRKIIEQRNQVNRSPGEPIKD
jgi:predicted HAD superfamily phosphohydrolase YqeG